ncbi:MAG: phosphonate metabolism protein/1,5-bisphosphokinase (PRPP-forming) PhnN, partial [Rhodocyclaceae bacterium]|nr:phosphonate metabolism protein/1,5-bisphosphokinase (PRPP-forming) PhnN [Rhodocyclaceae bacterium]
MNGRLVLVVGPSGAGKDSVIDWASARLAAAEVAHVRFARRTINRPEDAGGERHVAVDDETFDRMREAGAFALWWRANGHAYGIGVEIVEWLAAGYTVVVSGSRAGLRDAAARFPGLEVVTITAPEALLRQRLLERGRESPYEVDARLERARSVTVAPDLPGITIINDRTLEEAGAV